MTKYIDRYYLNWELYGIKFAGGGGWRQPWANTIAYYPLESNTNDATWTYNLTNSWITFGVLWWVTCANFDGSSSLASNNNFHSYWTWDCTVSVWWCPTSNSQWVWRCIWHSSLVMNSKNWYVEWTSAPTPLDTWTHIVFVITWWKLKIYSNWTSYLDTNFSSNLPWTLFLWQNDGWGFIYEWWLSNLIFEDKARTQQEIEDYFDQTKSLYGIS